MQYNRLMAWGNSDWRVGSSYCVHPVACTSPALKVTVRLPKLTFTFSRGKVTAAHSGLAQLFSVHAALFELALPFPISLLQWRRLVASVCMLCWGPHTHGGPAQRTRGRAAGDLMLSYGSCMHTCMSLAMVAPINMHDWDAWAQHAQEEAAESGQQPGCAA